MAFDKGVWKPNRGQELFLAIPITIPEAFIGGSNGFGKSDVLLVYGLVHKWHENPRFKQVFMRRTFPELKNEIVPRSREIYLRFGATFNKSDMLWTFPRLDQFGSGAINAGAMIFFGHCEDDNDVYKYDTMEINLFTPDELTSFNWFQYSYISLTRVRTSDPNLPAITRGAGTPGGVGHTFVKKRFVDPYPKGGRVIVGKAGRKRIYIHATLADNPYIDPNYKSQLEALPEAEKQAKLHGNWNAFSGQVFDEFRDKLYVDEPSNALHVVEPFTIPDWWPRIIIGDWGFAAMCYVGFYAISPDKRLYLYRELYWLKTKIAEWGPIVKTFLEKENIRSVKFCKSAGQDRGQEHTIQEQISTELGVSVELSNNSPGSRVAGKMLVHEYLRWQPRPTPKMDLSRQFDNEYAMWLMRNKGLIDYRQYVDSFNPIEAETNLPRFQIFRCNSDGDHVGHPNCCPMMIEAIKACSYAKPKDDKPAEDVAEFNGDDPYDDLRYACDTAERYFVEAEQEFKKVQAQAEIIKKLEENKDWTAFYRNMHKIEADESVQPIKRYRH